MPIRGPAIDAIYATGTIEPTVMLPIAPRVAGRLVKLHVDEGNQVRKGQLLAQFDDMDLSSTVAELAARARFAHDQFERTQTLVRQGFLAAIELQRVRADMEAADAALKRAQTQRDFMALSAPADGLIIRRDGEVGQFIPVGQAVFYLSCCAPLRISAEVDEEDIPRVHVGQKTVLHADALPDQILQGEVSEITPKGDPVARSYRVRIKLSDVSSLKVGMTVDANLIVNERENVLLVPTKSIHNNEVWIVKDKKLHKQPVRTGITGAVLTEIIEGLTEEMHIVEIPSPNLHEGRIAHIRSQQEK